MRNISAEDMTVRERPELRRIWLPKSVATGEHQLTGRDITLLAAAMDIADHNTRTWAATNAVLAHRSGFSTNYIPKVLDRLVECGLLESDPSSPGVRGLSAPRVEGAFLKVPVGFFWASPGGEPRWSGSSLPLAVRSLLALLNVMPFGDGREGETLRTDLPRAYIARCAGLDLRAYARGLALLHKEPWLLTSAPQWVKANHRIKQAPVGIGIEWGLLQAPEWAADAARASDRELPQLMKREQAMGQFSKKQHSAPPTFDQAERDAAQRAAVEDQHSAPLSTNTQRPSQPTISTPHNQHSAPLSTNNLNPCYTDTLLSSYSTEQILSSSDTFSISSLPPSSSNSPSPSEEKTAAAIAATEPSLASTSQEEEGREDEQKNEEKPSVTYTVKPEFEWYGTNAQSERHNLVGVLLSNLPAEVATAIDTHIRSRRGVSAQKMHNHLRELVSRKWKLPEVVAFCYEVMSCWSGKYDSWWLYDFGLPSKGLPSPAVELELQEEKRQRKAAQEADDARKSEQLSKLGAGSELLSFISNLEPNVRHALTTQVVTSGTGSVKNLEQPLGNCWKMGWTKQGLASFVSERYRTSTTPVKSPVGWLTTVVLPVAGIENPR